MQFLVWEIKTVMGSWGTVACGPRSRRIRTERYPTKSAILGMLVQSQGLVLASPEAAALEASLDFSYLAVAGPSWEDFQTVQSRNANEGPFRSRAEVLLGGGTLTTALTHREYLSDIHAFICVYLRDGTAPVTLDALLAGLEYPKAAPFVGRRSCPPSAPFRAQIVDVDNPVAALRQIAGSDFRGQVGYEGTWPGVAPTQSVVRRDQPSNRRLWLFTTRTEHQI